LAFTLATSGAVGCQNPQTPASELLICVRAFRSCAFSAVVEEMQHARGAGWPSCCHVMWCGILVDCHPSLCDNILKFFTVWAKRRLLCIQNWGWQSKLCNSWRNNFDSHVAGVYQHIMVTVFTRNWWSEEIRVNSTFCVNFGMYADA